MPAFAGLKFIIEIQADVFREMLRVFVVGQPKILMCLCSPRTICTRDKATDSGSLIDELLNAFPSTWLGGSQLMSFVSLDPSSTRDVCGWSWKEGYDKHASSRFDCILMLLGM